MTEAMGHGVNQRSAIRMTPEEVDAFLAERRAMTMCSISGDGSIHAVAMWYGFLDGCVTVETKAKSQKVQNLRRDPRLTLLFEDGDYYDELRGVELVGRAEIIDDPDQMWELGLSVYERYNGPYSEELKPFVEAMLHKRVGIKLNVERTVSWDHRKLGLPSMRPAEAGVDFSIEQEVDVTPDEAIEAYASPAFYEGRPPIDNISVIEVVSHRRDASTALIEVRFKFTGSISPAVKAIVDPNKMSWITRTEVYLEERRRQFTVLPDHYPDRLSSSGGFRFKEGKAPQSATITVQGQLKVHVPIVGRSVERVIVSGLRAYLTKEATGLPDFTGRAES